MFINASGNSNSSIHLPLAPAPSSTAQATTEPAVSSRSPGIPERQSAQRKNSQNHSVQATLPPSTVNTPSNKTEISALEENLKPKQREKLQKLKKGGDFVVQYKAWGELDTLLKSKDETTGNLLSRECLYELATEKREDDGLTVVHREAKKRSGHMLVKLIDRLGSEQGKKILELEDKDGNTPLDYLMPRELGLLISHSIDRLKEGGDIALRPAAIQTIEAAAEKLSSNQLYEVLKSSHRQLFEVLKSPHRQPHEVLKYISDDCDSHLIHEVVKTGDIEKIDYFMKRLTFQHVDDLGKLSENNHLKRDETILHIAATKKNGPEIIECITQKLPSEQKNKVLIIDKYKYDYESTLMQAAIKIGSVETVSYLLTQMKPQQLEESIKPEKDRKTLLDIFTPEQLGRLLKFKDKQGYTLLHRMARENSSKVIEYFTEKLPSDDLYELVTLQGPDGSTPVQAAAKIREIETSNTIIEATHTNVTIQTLETIEPPIDSLIKRLEPEQRHELLTLQDEDNHTLTHTLAPSENFEILERLREGMTSEQQQEIHNLKAQLKNEPASQ